MDEAYRVRLARERGETRHRIERVLPAPHWGIRADTEPVSLAERCRAFLPRMPAGGFFSHQTAALLLGLPLPPWEAGTDRLHVALPAGHRAVDARLIIGHELQVRPHDVRVVDGIPIAVAPRIFRDLAAVLRLPDLVVVGDAMIARGAPLTTLDELARAAVVPRFRGRLTALAAVPLLSERSESPPETLLRVAVTMSDLPPVEVNVVIRDAAGRFVARLDLKFRDYALGFEYEGDGHRTDGAQWRRDVTRLDDVAAAGVGVIRATADDLPWFEDPIRRARRRLRALGWRSDDS